MEIILLGHTRHFRQKIFSRFLESPLEVWDGVSKSGPKYVDPKAICETETKILDFDTDPANIEGSSVTDPKL